MTDWYVRHAGEAPIGPVSAELLVQGIAAGKVPVDAEVCKPGGDEWLPLEAIEQFQDALPDDGVQTRVIVSPWFMDRTNPSTPGSALPDAYSEDDDAATRVAAAPSSESQPGVALLPAPQPARRAQRSPAANAPRPPPPTPRPGAATTPPAPSRPHVPPPAPSRPHVPPPALTPSAGAARYDEVDDEAATRVAEAPTRTGRSFDAPRPAAGVPAIPLPPPALTPLQAVTRRAHEPLEPAAAPAPRPAPAPPPLQPRAAEPSLIPLLLLIVALVLALGAVLVLLARR